MCSRGPTTSARHRPNIVNYLAVCWYWLWFLFSGKVLLTYTLMENFTDDLNDSSSDEWAQLQDTVCQQVGIVNHIKWRHNGCDGVSNDQPNDCLLNRLFGRKLKQPSKLRVTGLSVGNSPVTGEVPAQRASYAENVSIWWRHHDLGSLQYSYTKNSKRAVKSIYT